MQAAKIGVHDIFGSHLLVRKGILKEPKSPFDPDIAKWIKWFKQEHGDTRAIAKKRIHCLTSNHEVLTPHGWMEMRDYAGGPIAQWDNGNIAFVEPTAWNVGEVQDEELVVFDGRGFQLEATANHRIPWFNTNGSLHVSPARSISGVTHRVPISGKMGGLSTTSLTDVQLAVAIQADGSFRGACIWFNLKKPRKIERLRTLLGPVEYKEVLYKTGAHQFTIHRDALRGALSLLRGDKTFSMECLLALPLALKEGFIEELSLWDGSVKRGGAIREYNTTEPSCAVVAQTIAHLCGREALLRKWTNGNIRVSFNRRTRARTFSVSRRRYSGRVYCPTVPSSFFLVRFGNTISVTGNSGAYGQGTRNMAKDLGLPVEVVKELDLVFARMAPKVAKWQRETQWKAHQEGQLCNPFGYSHPFWHVFEQRKNGTWGLGQEAREALAFLPQSTGAAMCREAVLEVFAHPEHGKRFWLLVPIHDSLFIEAEEDFVLEAIRIVRGIMTRPWPELGGLSVDVEVKTGLNWSAKHIHEERCFLDDCRIRENPDGMTEWKEAA